MKVKLVAFCGAKESGKSTAAELFKNCVNIKTEEVAFAGHLKNTCSKVFNIDMKYFLDPKLKEVELDSYVRLTKEYIEQIFQEFDIKEYDYDKHVRPHMGQVFDTPRKLLQYVGTELLHPVDKLIHVNITLKKINPEVITLVTDLRFPQEFDALYGREDFLPVYVNNKRAEHAAATDSHASERGWQKFKDRCVELDNNGSLSDLMANLQKLVQENL
jgi:hypothetical protein